MHIGVKNQSRGYKMMKGVDVIELEKTSIEKDLLTTNLSSVTTLRCK